MDGIGMRVEFWGAPADGELQCYGTGARPMAVAAGRYPRNVCPIQAVASAYIPWMSINILDSLCL
jgi:hypothetical protein